MPRLHPQGVLLTLYWMLTITHIFTASDAPAPGRSVAENSCRIFLDTLSARL